MVNNDTRYCYDINLQYPKAQEGPELVPLVVKAIIFAGLQDPEQEEATQARGPCDDEDRDYNVACLISITTKRKGEDCQKNEIGASSEIGELVELECERY